MAKRTQARASGGFFRTLWRAIRQTFHESTGAMFLVFAAFWTAAGVREWKHGAATWTLVAVGALTLLLVSFGVSSFLAARRVR